MTKVLFNITHGFQARMLLRSRISEVLRERGARLIVLSPNSDEEYFRREFEHPQVELEQMPSRFSRLESHLITLRQYFLMNPSLGASINYKNDRLRLDRPAFYWFARCVNSVLGRAAILRRAYLALESRAFPGSEFDDLLRRCRPDLVVTGTPGYTRHDVHLLRAAKRAGIRTATVMLSWDNLTTKGYMGAVPDRLLVWSDLMAGEAMHYHHYPADRIIWCGAAQFDVYHGFRERFDRMRWRREHGIVPDATLIVYGTINPGVLPHEPAIVRAIVDAARAGQFQRKVHVYVRLHPQVVQGHWARKLQPYLDMRADNVTVEIPEVKSNRLDWDLSKEDAVHLAELLTAADVVATPGSTLVIDAACVDTPAISVQFDEQDVPDGYSCKRFVSYTHYQTILTTGGISVANSLDEFVQLVRQCADSRQRGAAGRQAVLRQQFNEFDGRAGDRTGNLLMDLALEVSTNQDASRYSSCEV